MKKNTKSRKRKAAKRRRNLIMLLVVFLVVFIAAVGMLLWGKQQEKKEAAKKETEKKTAFVFPYLLEKEQIQVDSLFPFTGSNVDCNYEEGEDIAALQITNKSEKHLTQATFTVQLEDKTTFTFKVEDLPAGVSATLFEKENRRLDATVSCKKIQCDATFEDASPMMENQVSVAVDGMNVVVTNQSAEELTNMVLHCHIQLDDGAYGGLTYQYPVETIPGGSSVTIEAIDCYLESAMVVRISQDTEEQENGQMPE